MNENRYLKTNGTPQVKFTVHVILYDIDYNHKDYKTITIHVYSNPNKNTTELLRPTENKTR